ncbi:MAG: PilZ domain-containing protein, partial [Oligoflexia bacterium]|nr:PilZ domain-containing protein [Oligoflexia bacterium]
MTETPKKFQRKHLRAPIRTMILYEDEGHVFKAQLSNISKGGVLVSNLPNLPTINIIGTVIDIPEMPVVKSDDLSKLQAINLN